MPAIQLQTTVAMIPLRPDVIGVFFKDSIQSMDRFATTADREVLNNQVVLLGVEVLAASDDTLINQVKVYYDDSDCPDGWVPELGKLNERTFIRSGPARLVEEYQPYKVATMFLDNATPVTPGVMTLILA